VARVTPASRRRQWGTGSVYKRSDGRWFGAVDAGFHANGKRRRITVSAKTEAEAKARLKRKMADLDRGAGALSSRTNIKTWAEKWLAITEKTDTPNAHTTDRVAVGWIIETIGDRMLTQVTPADVRAVSDAIRTGRDGKANSSSTANRYHSSLIRMLKAAQVEGYDVPANALVVKAPKRATHDRTSMTPQEALAILREASALPWGSRWLAAFLQGARQGECLGLTLPNITDGRLRLAWQLQPLPYNVPRDRTSGFRIPDGYEHQQLVGQMHLVRPKSKAGWRVAPIVPLMQTALDHWLDIRPDSPHGLVWPAADGSPRDENEDRDEFTALQAAAGVAHPSGRPYFVHEARHTTATLLLSLKVDEATRVAIMGHSSHASTQAYEHADLTMIGSALKKVAKRLELG